jgi:hypothetical protein
MQYIFLKKTCQSILNLLWKKNVQIILGFLAICKKKENILFFIYFLGFGLAKTHFPL